MKNSIGKKPYETKQKGTNCERQRQRERSGTDTSLQK